MTAIVGETQSGSNKWGPRQDKNLSAADARLDGGGGAKGGQARALKTGKAHHPGRQK